MALKIAFPVEKSFKLDKADPTGETYVVVRQATYGEHAKRDEMFSETTRIYDDQEKGRVQVKQKWNLPDVWKKEIFLTLCDCNIERVAADGTSSLLFQFVNHGGHSRLNMKEGAFSEALGFMPLDVALEIHEKVMEVNPDWAPPAPEASAPTSGS